MVTARKLTETEKAQGYTSIRYVTPGKASKKGVVRYYHYIDPETGKTSGSISRISYERAQRGQRKFKGVLFVHTPPPQELARQLRAREERLETKELAKKEAEFEAKRIAEGKIKAKDVVLTQKGAAKLLRERLAEAPPTRAELEAEQRARIGVTLAKQLGLGIRETISEKIERKKAKIKGIKLVEVEKKRIEKEKVIKPKRPLELFSPLARKKLGIAETPEGLLEIRKDERKIVLEPRRVELRKTFIELVEEPFKKKEVIRKEVIAELPVTAEFRAGFERQLGVRERPSLIGIKTPSGVLTFKTIQEPITRKLKEAFRPSIQFFEERELELRRELRGRPPIIVDRQFRKLGIQELRTIQLRAGQLIVGAEIGARRQIAEEPLETAAIIGVGAAFGAVAAKPAIAKAAAFRISTKALGATFVGVTGVEAGIQIRKRRFVEAGKIIGERAAEALLFIGAGKLAARGVEGVRRIRFERGIRAFERKIPKFTPKELEARLRVGGIETRQVKRFPREVQTTFDTELRVKTAEEALRTRIFAKAKAPLKRPPVPERIAIIPIEEGPPLITLERVGKFDISAFGKVPKQFTRLRVRVGRLKDITIRDIGIQKVLVEPKPKVGKFRILPEPPKFKPPIEKLPKPFKGKPAKGLDRALLAEPDTRLKLISKIESLVGKPGRLTPQEFARQKGFLFIEPPAERPRIDITQFAGREIKPGGVLTPRGTVKPITRVISPVSLGLFGTIKGLGVGEAQDIISGQKLRTRLDISQKVRQDLASDLARITGTKPKPAFDIASGLASIQEIDVIKEQEQLLITMPMPRVPTRGRPEFPPPREPLRPPLPPPPPPLIPFLIPRLFLGVPIKRKRIPLRPEFGYTPGFMSAVLGEFGPPPKPGQIFTGQERRYKLKGKPFLTPLPKRREGIIQLVARQLGGR